MDSERLLEEIREANLAYLMLAQHLIREDRPQALYRLGLSDEVAELISHLTPGQLVKVASSNLLLCRFRFNDEIVWGLLSGNSKLENTAGMHANIVMAGQYAEAD